MKVYGFKGLRFKVVGLEGVVALGFRWQLCGRDDIAYIHAYIHTDMHTYSHLHTKLRSYTHLHTITYIQLHTSIHTCTVPQAGV